MPHSVADLALAYFKQSAAQQPQVSKADEAPYILPSGFPVYPPPYDIQGLTNFPSERAPPSVHGDEIVQWMSKEVEGLAQEHDSPDNIQVPQDSGSSRTPVKTDHVQAQYTISRDEQWPWSHRSTTSVNSLHLTRIPLN